MNAATHRNYLLAFSIGSGTSAEVPRCLVEREMLWPQMSGRYSFVMEKFVFLRGADYFSAASGGESGCPACGVRGRFGQIVGSRIGDRVLAVGFRRCPGCQCVVWSAWNDGRTVEVVPVSAALAKVEAFLASRQAPAPQG